MKLYWGDYDDQVLIGEPQTSMEANQMMADHLQKIGFKSYYTRITMAGDVLWFDYGSHSRFFFLKELSDEYMKGE